MKQLIRILSALLCIVACICLYFGWTHAVPQTPLVVIISNSADGLPAEYSSLSQQLQSENIRVEVTNSPADLTGAVQDAADKNAAVIIFHIDGNLPDRDFTAAARRAGCAMIFAGSAPVRALNAQYDKIWYLGASADHAGELMGQTVGAAFRDAILPDADGDTLLDYLVLTDGTAGAAAILTATEWEYGRYGVFGSDCDPDKTVISSGNLAAQWSALQQRPEVIFCIGRESALAAYGAAYQLGWLNGETPVHLTAVVENSTAAQELNATGAFSCIVHYDEATERETLYVMTLNLLHGRDPAFGTELRRDMAEPRYDLPYLQIQTGVN